MEIIRIHTAEGVVYARVMELWTDTPWGDDPSYLYREQMEVPAGLSQQEAADWFRSEGWTVEQDMGTDFDNPVWVDETESRVDSNTVFQKADLTTCVLCGKPNEPWPHAEGEEPRGWGNNPEPVADYEAGRCCNQCNAEKVIPVRMGLIKQRGWGLGKPTLS